MPPAVLVVNMIKLDSISFKYNGFADFALQDISLSVNAGEYICIVGENGCGKSTLIKLMLGLLKPASGSIVRNVKNIGYVPQKKELLTNFPITVFELLDSYRRLLKIKDKGCVQAILREVNMELLQQKRAGDLSGGQLQKLYIARALIGTPALIVLDEPSTGIDFKGQKEIYALLKKLNTEKKMTIVSVDHNLDAAVINSSLIFHIAGGKGHLCSPRQYASEFLPNDFINFKPVPQNKAEFTVLKP